MLTTKPTTKQFFILFMITFALRATTFYFFMQHTHRYKRYQQPDSLDYHIGAVGISSGRGMFNVYNNQPLFWRTPGYPLFLSFFYSLCPSENYDFNCNHTAQKIALWVQIFLCSFIPIILFYLAYLLTKTYAIAWAMGWIACFHVGLILSSTFLLTDGIAVIFFYLFLIYLYKLLLHKNLAHPFWHILIMTVLLSAYTWIRPMGEFISILSAVLILVFCPTNTKKRFLFAGIFLSMFFITLLPWYIRNYALTDEWFFCPLIGPYLNCFCAPKILRHVHNIPLAEGLKLQQRTAAIEGYHLRGALEGTGKYVSPLIGKKVALPLIFKHPFYFAYDWIVQVLKTTFDLYATHFINLSNGTFWYDPIEEILTEKISGTLFREPMPIFMRIIGWVECIFSILMWVGLLAGTWVFFLAAFFKKQITQRAQQLRTLWFISGLLIGYVICMTGGFGYARLRLPIEPLMIILSLIWWHYILNKKSIKNS